MSKVKHCYICYAISDAPYHVDCLKKLFNNEKLPEIAFSDQDINDLALELVKEKKGLPGVQEKLSLSLETSLLNGKPSSGLTIVGYLGGEYIFKPPTAQYPYMPEIEDLTMHLAESAGIKVALHGLIEMKNGKLAYITKRFDRIGQQKIAVEDLCQLSQKMTENKYKGSYEQLAKIIVYYTSQPGEETLKFFELILFNFLVGNADMHLKNFSLTTQNPEQVVLAPSYDLLSTRLLIPPQQDPEEVALTLNGKKSNLRYKDFMLFGKNITIPEKVIVYSINSMLSHIPRWQQIIQQSFLPEDLKQSYCDLIDSRAKRLVLDKK